VLNRIFIDNYRCFTNFEYRPTEVQLILGTNGAGKTSVFDVLETLCVFITRGTPTAEAFPAATLTAWDRRSVQTCELGVAGNGGQYEYRLAVEHDRPNQRNRIKSESLRFDDVELYQFDGNDAHLFRDNGTAGPVFPFDWSRSAISTIPDRNDNRRLTWFRRRMEQVYVFSPDPVRMTAQSEAESPHADRRLHQLASWLRRLMQQRADFGASLLSSLREMIDGLVNFRLAPVSETTSTLQFEFAFGEETGGKPGSSFHLPFDRLSDGQRNLVALYTILLAGIHDGATVCLDEPDNFISLRELQPWIAEVRDRVEDRSGQCLLVSHHPELINYLAAQHGVVFYRDESGPARIKPFEWTEEDSLPPAELVARGWK
jgi:predicted ATPase